MGTEEGVKGVGAGDDLRRVGVRPRVQSARGMGIGIKGVGDNLRGVGVEDMTLKMQEELA